MTSTRKVNPDLEKERAKCNFEGTEFTTWWYGGTDKLKLKRRIDAEFHDDPYLNHPVPLEYLSHKERYEEAIRVICLTAQKIRRLQTQGEGQIDFETMFTERKTVAAPLGNPLGMHFGMFVNMIIAQGTDEQHAKWVDRAKNLEIIGCYASTELAHGTFIRGLGTTATYDPSTQEFILNSPTQSSFKFWPGGLGQTSSHCVLMAQLITQDTSRGIFPFIVPLRDLSTYMPLKGITVGEIGPKQADTMNNGFLGLDNVRIPLDHMLMRSARVTEDGTFVKEMPSILTYQTMTLLRVSLVSDMSEFLARAATIAIRYSAVRRQSQINAGEEEVQVIDHLTQQYKIFPHLAKCIVFKLAAGNITELHEQVTLELTNGQFSRLPEMHALSCCLKAVTSMDAVVGVETCRLACGGHGYLASSGFPGLTGYVAMSRAFEGENTVMLLQTSRFLVKSWKNAVAGKPLTPTVKYLAEVTVETAATSQPTPFQSNIPGIIAAFQRGAGNTLRSACEEMERHKSRGMTNEEAANAKSIELAKAAELHCRAYLLHSSYVWMSTKLAKDLSPALGRVLSNIIELYAVDSALNNLDLLLRFVKISEVDVAELQGRLEKVLQRLRPNAVGVVDAFEFSDNVLSSALGSHDGMVYERLFAEALKSPLNQEPVNKSFDLYLKPLMAKSKM